MKSFLTGMLVALAGAAVVVFQFELLQSPDGLNQYPILAELTDTYQQGWQGVRHIAGTITLDELPGPRPTGAMPAAVPTTWQRAGITAKLADKGFSAKRLRQAAPYLDYIERFQQAAVQDMRQTGVSASITLAQGILESNAGRSRLTRQTNNHFGIKARHRPTARAKIKERRYTDIVDEDFAFRAPAIGVSRFHDDYSYDRFEVYPSAAESYRRHSDLLTRPCKGPYRGCYRWIWEAFPIQRELVDIAAEARRHQPVSGIAPERFFDGRTRLPYYAAQAAGLKMAGYATARNYHQQLAYLIETYELWRFDIDLLRAMEKGSPIGQESVGNSAGGSRYRASDK